MGNRQSRDDRPGEPPSEPAGVPEVPGVPGAAATTRQPQSRPITAAELHSGPSAKRALPPGSPLVAVEQPAVKRRRVENVLPDAAAIICTEAGTTPAAAPPEAQEELLASPSICHMLRCPGPLPTLPSCDSFRSALSDTAPESESSRILEPPTDDPKVPSSAPLQEALRINLQDWGLQAWSQTTTATHKGQELLAAQEQLLAQLLQLDFDEDVAREALKEASTVEEALEWIVERQQAEDNSTIQPKGRDEQAGGAQQETCGGQQESGPSHPAQSALKPVSDVHNLDDMRRLAAEEQSQRGCTSLLEGSAHVAENADKVKGRELSETQQQLLMKLLAFELSEDMARAAVEGAATLQEAMEWIVQQMEAGRNPQPENGDDQEADGSQHRAGPSRPDRAAQKLVSAISTLRSTLAGMRRSAPDVEQFKVACTTLLKCISNVAASPDEAKFRSIRLANKTLQQRVVGVPGALDVLRLCGFQKEGECLVLAREGVQPALLQEVLQEIDQARRAV